MASRQIPKDIMKRAIVEDPTIATTAAAEFRDVWSEIEQRYAAGEPLHVARELVLAQAGPRMTKSYGREVSDRVIKVALRMTEKEISAAIRAARHHEQVETMKALTVKRKGRMSLIDRFSYWAFGVAWS
jgi:hypothetical protein